MTDDQSLTKQTLARLKQMADGNGIDPKSIELIESQEDVYVIDGQIRLKPSFETQARAYAGPIKNKELKVFPSFSALQEEVNRQKEAYSKSATWMDEAIKELKEDAGYGWGHDGGKISLPGSKMTLAANEKCPTCQALGLTVCPQCQGKKVVMCNYCCGKGEESCYNCFGKGEDPAYPGQPCHVCRGTRMAPCRYCRRTETMGLYPGYVHCSTCQGKGGMPCAQCQGAGSATQEVTIDAGATISFAIQGGAQLPSALLRNLDRLGMINLPKGHADIVIIEPEKDQSDEEKNLVKLQAKVPFAELKLRIDNRLAIASAFGKRGVILGLPPFLDDALRPYRDRLLNAAKGQATFDEALEARAIRGALKLVLSGNGNIKALRQIYPVGLSPDTAKEILSNMEVALRELTLRARAIVAVMSLSASALLFASVFLSPLHTHLVQSLSPTAWLMLQAFLPVVIMGLSGYAFSHASRWILSRRFPDMKIHLSQKIGKIGYSTMAGILVIYGVVYTIMKSGI